MYYLSSLLILDIVFQFLIILLEFLNLALFILTLLNQPHVLLFLFIKKCPTLLEVFYSLSHLSALIFYLFSRLFDLVEESKTNHSRLTDGLLAQRALSFVLLLKDILLGAFETICVLVGTYDHRESVPIIEAFETDRTLEAEVPPLGTCWILIHFCNGSCSMSS